MESFVQRSSICYVGPAILEAILKQKINDQKFIHAVEEFANAKVRFLSDTAEVKCYGSQKEIDIAKDIIEERVERQSEKLKAKDAISYPDKLTPFCDIKPGLKVAKLYQSLTAIQITDWELIQSATLILAAKPNTENLDSDEDIRRQLNEVKVAMPKKYLNIWEKPEIYGNERFKKVNFKCQKIAIYCCKVLRKLLRNISIFLDKEIKINVLKTKLYPSVVKLAEKYPLVEVIKKDFDDRYSFFRIKKKKEAPCSAQQEVNDFMQELRKVKVFGSCVIEDLNISLPDGAKVFIYRQLKKFTKEIGDESVEIQISNCPSLRIEVFGEYKQRERVANILKLYISNLIKDIKNNMCTFYKRELSIRHTKLLKILHEINDLRLKHDNVTISVLGGGEYRFSSNKAQPVVQLLSDSAADVKLAAVDVEVVLNLDDSFSDPSDSICVMCCVKVHLPNGSEEKKQEKVLKNKLRTEKKQQRKGEIEEGSSSKNEIISIDNHDNLANGGRLTLCGCIYCTSCLSRLINLQLEEHSASLKFEEVVCLVCKKTILLDDLRRLLSYKIREKFKKQALRNYLYAESHAEINMSSPKLVVHECTKSRCKTLMLRPENGDGVYRCINGNCRSVYCIRCGGCVMNEMDFKWHMKC